MRHPKDQKHSQETDIGLLLQQLGRGSSPAEKNTSIVNKKKKRERKMIEKYVTNEVTR